MVVKKLTITLRQLDRAQIMISFVDENWISDKNGE